MSQIQLAFGPEAPAFGSWEWIGADLCRAVGHLGISTATFCDTVPDCDLAVFVKFKPRPEILSELKQRCRLAYCPVDLYGSAAEIDADAPSLRCFDRIIIHCERLRRYCSTYAPVEYLDHHLKFIADPPAERRRDGPLLWIGNRSNLAPVIDWLNHRVLPGDVWLLTDFPGEAEVVSADELGVRSSQSVRVGRWTPDRHVEWTRQARAAFDVKGDDFRARHKPPTKALDFLASGLPMAMNADSSSTEHLQTTYGFALAPLEDGDRWLSDAYWREVQSLAARLRRELSLSAIAQRFLQLTADLRPARGQT